MNDSCRREDRKGEKDEKSGTFWTSWTWMSDCLEPTRRRWTEKSPGMEAGADEEDGTFTNISLADDPGRPHDTGTVNMSRRRLTQIGCGSSLMVGV